MLYALLIYSAETDDPAPGTPEFQALLSDYEAFGRDIKAAGVERASEALQPTATATTVRVRNGEALVTDGPFAETKEQLAGFYILDCKDLDEALAYAAKIPTAKYGSIEVRPVMTFS